MAAADKNIVENPKIMAKGTEDAAPKTDATPLIPIATGTKFSSLALSICIPLGSGIPIANAKGDKDSPIIIILSDVFWGSRTLSMSSI